METVEYSTLSSEILYRRLDFGINILDEPVELFSVQEIEVNVPTRKRTVSDDLSKLRTQILFPSALCLWQSLEKKTVYKKNRRKSNS